MKTATATIEWDPQWTLMHRLDHLRHTRWKGKRSADRNYSQGHRALLSVAPPFVTTQSLASMTIRAVTAPMVSGAVSKWSSAEGLSPDTITKRLAILRMLGVDTSSAEPFHAARPRQPAKWWLTPEDEKRVVTVLRIGQWNFLPVPGKDVARFIQWTTRTGLRIEESLRLTWGGIQKGNEGHLVRVPGTKTAASASTLPLCWETYSILIDGQGDAPLRPERLVFQELTYENLRAVWQEVRERFGWQDIPTCTLKALRRSAARYLHVTLGMPLHLVQQYLRHENLDTTMGYLKLTGGYSEAEFRRYMK